MNGWRAGAVAVVMAVGGLALATAAVSDVGLAALWVVYFTFNNPYNDESFDREIWLAQFDSRDAGNPRGPMSDDVKLRLIAGHPSRAEVLELLGPADAGDDPDQLSYILGKWSGQRQGIDTLDVHFDEDGHVDGAYRTHH